MRWKTAHTVIETEKRHERNNRLGNFAAAFLENTAIERPLRLFSNRKSANEKC